MRKYNLYSLKCQNLKFFIFEIDVYLYNYDSMIQLCFEIKIEKW